ncbi:MAG TPA: FecR domain-containing protein, partial [Candidatus Acidoferrales bacterium]|nr:FecR domain-containing protein [Candidatus Acidoferrales bacterium]
MKNPVLWRGATLAIAFLLSLIVSLPAQADSNGVARISLLHGSVTLQRGDSGDVVSASVNAPLTVGDYLSTTGNSRAEVQFDNATFVRIASDSQLRFTQLDTTDHQLQLAAGTIELGILRLTDAHPQVQTPSVTIRPDDIGKYRITVTADGNTLFTVRSGRADLITSQGSQTVAAGQTIRISGSAANPQIQRIDTIAFDDFDRWNDDRDQYAQSALDVRYANDGIVGLD